MERPELQPPLDSLSEPVAIPENRSLSEPLATPDVAPTDVDSRKQTEPPSTTSLSNEPAPVNPLASLDQKPTVSKVPRPIAPREFDLPAIENRKTELAKRELSSRETSPVPELNTSRVPLLNAPTATDGEFANRLPSDSIAAPSESGDLTPMRGQRDVQPTIGGEESRAVLEGIAQAGLSQSPSSGLASRSSLPALSKPTFGIDEGELDRSPRPAPAEKFKKPTGVASLATGKVLIPPSQASNASASESVTEPSVAPAPSDQPTKKASTQSATEASGETLKRLSQAYDSAEPSLDSRSSPTRSIAKSTTGRKENSLSLEAAFESLSLPGPKRLPRIPSAVPTRLLLRSRFPFQLTNNG